MADALGDDTPHLGPFMLAPGSEPDLARLTVAPVAAVTDEAAEADDADPGAAPHDPASEALGMEPEESAPYGPGLPPPLSR